MELQHWEHVAIGASIVIIGLITKDFLLNASSILLFNFSLGLAGIGINGHVLLSYFNEKNSYRNPLQLNNVLTNLGIILLAFPLSSLAGLRNEYW
jgi:hypothetical protein